MNCLINITEKLELIEAGKAGPVGNDPPSPRCSTPHSQQETTKTEYMMNDINVVDGSIQMDQSLPDISLQVNKQKILINKNPRSSLYLILVYR